MFECEEGKEDMSIGDTLTILCLVFMGAACVHHIAPYEKKTRHYESAGYASPDAARSRGSLWSEGAPGLFEDARASRVGDIVTITIDERSDATREAETDTSRESTVEVGIPSFLHAMQGLVRAKPDLNPEQLISAMSNSEFQGSGSTTRSGKLTAILPVRIRRLLPNGDYFVEGSKVLLLNDEETHLYISGVVRPVDIMPDNSVASSLLADVELEYTGRGVLSERQSPGWLARALDYVWPF